MPDYFHISGKDHDEIHRAGPNPGDPSILVAKVSTPEDKPAPNLAQAAAEALNVVDIFEAELDNLPATAKARVREALAKVRRVPRP